MNDRNLFRLAMLAVALFVAIEASPTAPVCPIRCSEQATAR